MKPVLVIGGGIAGIQAALDIANAGFRVILVEKTSSVGGHMLQFSKVFPTLDCPQCIGTPKMVEVASHPNIELMTCSEVDRVSGSAGEFRVVIRKKARYIDPKKCTGCGECAKVCTVSLPNKWDAGISTRKAAYMLFPQAVPAKYVIDKRGTSPCRLACPAGINVQGYIALIAQGKFEEALGLIRQKVPFPGVLGRVCPHPCEGECNRGKLDQPLAIAALKRFAADHATGRALPAVADRKGEKVAVIGAGAAGLTVAHRLARSGHQVTVFEASPVVGGMLRMGIPEYRLPREVLQTEIDLIKNGVEIKTGARIDKEKFAGLKKEFKAIFIGTGAHRGLKLNIPGEELEGVIDGVSFLKRVNLGEEVKLQGRASIIGGGNVAIDAARTALRLGMEARILYRRSRQEMPATEEEVKEAEADGVKISFLVAPTRIIGEGRVKGVECIRMKLGEPDAGGRRQPIPIDGSEFVIEGDVVMPAVGQAPDLSFLDGSGVELTKRGTIFTTDSGTTTVPGVFAGGDVVRGPATVIEAVADGNRAAQAIESYLTGGGTSDVEAGTLPKVTFEALELRGVTRKPRQETPEAPVEKRIRAFEEVRLGFDEANAVEEAKRCLNCAGCSECYQCEAACDPRAIDHGMKDEYEEVDVGAIIMATGFEPFDPRLKPELGYGIYKNVVTALELERLDQAAGPTQGRILIDGKEPKNVVFIQCVGSRDKSVGNEYCSRVCCMYTAKQAYYVKHKLPGAKVTAIYIDIRAYGKGYEQFYERVQKDGVIYRRGSVSEICRRGDKLMVRAEDTILGEFFEEEADLVVLATGLVPTDDSQKVAEVLGISLGSDGFFNEAHPKLGVVESGIEGIFLAGCCQGPKDITDSVIQASAAAAAACAIVSKERARV